jgi:hypothetical protein
MTHVPTHEDTAATPDGALATARRELEAERRAGGEVTARLHALEAEIAELDSSLLYASTRRLLDARVVRLVRRSRAVAALERRVRAALRRAAA